MFLLKLQKENKKQSQKKKRERLDLKKNKKNQEVVLTRPGEKRKTMSDMLSIQKWSHLVVQDVLGLR